MRTLSATFAWVAVLGLSSTAFAASPWKIDDKFVGPPTVTANGCSMLEPVTIETVSKATGFTVNEIDAAGRYRYLSIHDFCVQPMHRLKRSVARSTNRPKPDSPGEWASFRALQQSDESGGVRPDGLVAATRHRNTMVQQSPSAEIAGIRSTDWAAIGPGNIGGRVRSISPNPGNADDIIIGSVSGGMWRTLDGGVTWAAVNDFMGNLAVSTVARDPSNANRLYAGTGEGFFNGDAVRGFGIFVSNDGGTNWTQMGGTVPVSGVDQSDFFYVNRIAVHPTNPNIVLAATTGSFCNWGGVWRTANALAPTPIWTKVYDHRALDVKFNPSDGNQVLVGEGSHCYNFGAGFVTAGGAVGRSTNAGATFPTRVSLAGEIGRRVEVAWAPATPGLALAMLENASGQLYRSIDGGVTWAFNSNPAHTGTQGWYDNVLWVDPTDSTKVLAGGINVVRGTGVASWWTANTALTWANASQWFYAPFSAHADQHAIVAHPGFNGTSNRTVFFGNDGGIYKAVDYTLLNANMSGNGWTNLNNGLAITQFYGGAGAVAGGVTRIVGGTQDNGHLVAPASGTSWVDSFGGDGGWAAVDPTDVNYVYGEYVFAAVHRATDGGTAFSSDVICDGTAPNVNNISEGLNGYCGSLATSKANFISPFILDPNNPNRMLVGADSLWLSTDVKAAAPSWTNIKPGTGAFNYVSAIAVVAGNSNRIWVGHNQGQIYCTTTGGAPWTLVTSTPNRMVLRILPDKFNPNRVFVTYGGFTGPNVYELTDATEVCKVGPTATAIHNNLPLAPVRTIAQHPTNAGWLYVGTEVGIFASTNGGANWGTSNDGPGNVSVDELFWIDSLKLGAATHGRGIFVATLPPGGGGYQRHDVNGDGKSDVIWNRTVGTQIIWHVNGSSISGGGVVQVASSGTIPAKAAPWQLTGVGDFNGDGRADVWWRNSTTGANEIWLLNGSNLTAGTVQVMSVVTPPVMATTWTMVASHGDFNGDGRSDILWRSAAGTYWFWHMNGATVLSTGGMDPVVTSFTLVGVGDVNGDGKSDVVFRNQTSGSNFVRHLNGAVIAAGKLQMVSTGTFITQDSTWSIVGVADYNDDGKADILWRQTTTGVNKIWHLNGAVISGAGAIQLVNGVGLDPMALQWSVAGYGDYNGDGKADVLWRHTTGGHRIWHLNSSVVVSGKATMVSTGTLPTVLVAGRTLVNTK